MLRPSQKKALLVFILIISLIMTWNTPTTTAQDDWTLLETISSNNLNRLSKLRTVNTDGGGIWLIESYSHGSQLYAGIVNGSSRLLKLSANSSGADIQFLTEYGIIMGMAVSPVSNELAVSTGYNTAIWNLASERQTRTIDVGHDSYMSVTFHPTNGTVVTRLFGEIAEWDRVVNVKTQVLEVPGAGPIADIDFAPSGLEGAIGLTSGVILMDWQNNQPVYSVISNRTNGKVRFNAAGTMLGFMSEGGYEIGLWDMAAQQSTIIFEAGYAEYGNDIGFSADGSVFAIADIDGVDFYDGHTGQYISSLPQSQFTDEVTALSFSDDGRFLITGQADGQVDIWAVSPVTQIVPPHATAGGNQLVFTSDEKATVSLSGAASSDLNGEIVSYEWRTNEGVFSSDVSPELMLEPGIHVITLVVTDNDGFVDMDQVVVEVRAFEADSGPVPPPIGVGETVWYEQVAWHGDVIAAATTEDIWLYDSDTLRQTGFVPVTTGLVNIVWHPTQHRLAISGGDGFSIELSVWNMTTEQYDWKIPLSESCGYSLLPISWSADGQLLALGLCGELHIYDGNTGTLIQSITGFGIEEVASIAWSPAGDRLITSSVGTLKVWDTSTWNLVTTLAQDLYYGLVEWIPETSSVAVEYNFHIQIWDINTSQLIDTLTTNHDNVVHSLKWNDSGGLLSGSYDGIIHIWDIETGQATTTLNVASLRSVTWSPDGTQIVIGGANDLFEVQSLPN